MKSLATSKLFDGIILSASEAVVGLYKCEFFNRATKENETDYLYPGNKKEVFYPGDKIKILDGKKREIVK